MTTVRRTAGRRLAVVAVLATSATGLGATGASADSRGETIAHRGGNSLTPESTLAAFGSALRNNVDGVEFDVQFTRDGVPVVFHDLRVDRTTNCTGTVRSFTWSRLRKCDAGSWFGGAFRGERVPTFSQALTFLQRRGTSKVFVHVKQPSARQAKVVVKTLRGHGLGNRVTVIASSRAELATMKRAGARRLGFVFNNPIGWSTNHPVLIPYNVTVTKALVRKAHKKGQKVYTVEGKPYSVAAARARGVDGVLVNSVGGRSAVASKPAVAKRLAGPPRASAAADTTLEADGSLKTEWW
ncbi:MAG: glycerophosphodiester phosphodiesterase [Sporichthyaceae bacterium]